MLLDLAYTIHLDHSERYFIRVVGDIDKLIKLESSRRSLSTRAHERKNKKQNICLYYIDELLIFTKKLFVASACQILALHQIRKCSIHCLS